MRTLPAALIIALTAAACGGDDAGSPDANAANAGVAAHLPQGFDVVGEQQRFAAHAGSGQRRLGAGVAATDDDYVKSLGVKHGPILRGPPQNAAAPP